jgi:catechol 2,3-dioxygenase-like lactoylglutathione lyase family enzyme
MTGAVQSRSDTIRSRGGELLSRSGLLIALVLLFVGLALFAPNFLTSRNLLNVLRAVAFNGIIACGMTFMIISGDIDEVTAYYSRVLGFRPENEDAVVDGDWQAGPKAVFGMAPGASHWYRGFVSPNNICGKLKFFVPMDQRPDRSARQRPGEQGITLHSVTVPDLPKVHELSLEHRLEVPGIADNEFGESSFVIHGPDGSAWQVIEKAASEKPPLTEFKLLTVNN